MNASELIVELVLAGMLMLAVLLMPAFAAKLVPLQLSAELLGVTLAGGFVLGVVVDRCADTILDRWLGYARCTFGKEKSKERKELLNPLSTADVFPEDWMRARLLAGGSEAVIKYFEQLRIRIRVARNMVVLLPALTVSASISVLLLPRPSSWTVPAVAAGFHVFALATTVWLGGLDIFKAPHTTSREAIDEEVTREILWWSPVTAWIAIQFGTALYLSAKTLPLDPSRAMALGAIFFMGAAFTFLSALAWFRITNTFNTSLWDHWRFSAPAELADACLGRNPTRFETRPLPFDR